LYAIGVNHPIRSVDRVVKPTLKCTQQPAAVEAHTSTALALICNENCKMLHNVDYTADYAANSEVGLQQQLQQLVYSSCS
jgi:hypothetical protein